MAKIHATSNARLQPLQGWSMALAPAEGVEAGDAAGSLAWIPALVPGTAAAALHAAGAPAETLHALDAREVWYRCGFGGEGGPPGTRVLRLGGLATLCDAWLNGQHLLRSESMFLAHALEVSPLLRGANELLLRFSPLEAELKKKRPRPRWKTPLVSRQQLRFVRTSVLGRATAWRVPPAVGPFREAALETRELPVSFDADLRTEMEGDAGVVRLALKGPAVASGTLRVGTARAALEPAPDGARAVLRIPGVRRWWPATHGEPFLHEASVELDLGGATIRLDLGKLGFRTVQADRSGGGFQLVVNGEPIFARGTCWSPPDPLRMWAPREEYARQLRTAREGGINMVRIPGTFAYEPDSFHELCDENGILVWQDFMFAGLDYPGEPAFLALVAEEARQTCSRLQATPSLAVLCGGSDGDYAPALLGLPWEGVQAPLREVLSAAHAAQLPSLPYLANSPGAGETPFHPEKGVTHYYGVGAFRRPVEDVRRSDVRFASECLGFANVPSQRFQDRWLPGGDAPVSSAAWKLGVPRDALESWDFDDVRDFYAQQAFGVDPAQLRARDCGRYLALSRVVTGELMANAFAEFRRVGTRCAGALVWTHRDLWPGAGWGLFDSEGQAKPAFWILRRALAPRAVFLTDEGLNGLAIHAVNDLPEPLTAELGFDLYRGPSAVASGRRVVTVPARGALRLLADDLVGRFTDSAYSYRFGPPGFGAAVATLRQESSVLSSAARFPEAWPFRPEEVGLQVSAQASAEGFELRLRATTYACWVALDLPEGCTPADNYFHLAPGVERDLRIEAPGLRSIRGSATPLNGLAVPFFAEKGAAA